MGAVKKLLWVALVLGATCASAQQKQMRIQFAEPVQLKAVAGHTEFDAYGRRFAVELQRNERLMQGLPAATRSQLTHAQLLSGKLDGLAGSWVRLTQVGSGLEGAIWDGQDLYVVTTLARIQKSLTTPVDAAPAQTVVYRLSDTLDSLPEAFCGLDEVIDNTASIGVSGLKQYRSLVRQIAATVTAVPAEQLSLSLIADTAFQQQNGNESADAMLARLNIVDGIFTDQIGVLLQPTELRLVPVGSDPFTATDPSQLLDQLSTFRANTPAVRTAGLAHLFTGKDLDSTTVGIAYRDALCEPSFGVSLSNNELGSFFSALVMAHELGHNFGAEHDGAPGGACAAVSGSYLMAPQVNGSSVFSSCSRNSIANSVSQARGICIVPAQYADLAASAPGTLDAAANSVFTLPITVRSIGNVAAIDAIIRFTLPTTLSFQGAVLPDGACTTAGADITCHLGEVPANSERVVELRLMSPQMISTSVVTSVGAANDYRTANGRTQTSLRFTSAVDLQLAMTVSPTSVYANDTFDITLDVTSTRTLTAHGGQVYVTLSGLEYDSATAGSHTCTPTSSNIRCDLADIPAGQTTRIVLHAHGENRGNRTVYAQVQITEDGDYSNNNAQAAVRIIAENDVLISASTDSLRFEPGPIQEVVYTLNAIGRAPSVRSQLRVWAPWNGRLDSVVPSAGICSLQGVSTLGLCEFGDLNPGDVRTVTVRFHTTSNGAATLSGEALHYTDTNTVWINGATTQIYSNLPIDVVARTSYESAVEGRERSASAGVESVGLQPAQNVVATLEVPAEVRLTAMGITNTNNWTCTLLTPQRGRCTGAFAATGGASITYGFISDVPGNYTARLTISADGDGDAANNTSEAILTIAPYIDVGVTTAETEMLLVMGQDHPVEVTVTTGPRPVPGVFIVAVGQPHHYVIASMTVNGTACSVDPNSGWGRCDLGDLPANAAIPVSLNYRTTGDGASGTARVNVFTSVGDQNLPNNGVEIDYTTIAYTDVQLQVAQVSASAVNGSRLTFPRITVSNTGTVYGRGAVVQIPLPAFTTVESISGAGAVCTGTTILRCEIWSFAPGSTYTLDIALNTSGTGEFSSNVTLQTLNDSVASNNSANVQLSVTAPPPSSGGGGGGSAGGGAAGGGASKGGGGQFEWLALAFLGLLAAYRAWRSPRLSTSDQGNPGRQMKLDAFSTFPCT